MSRGTWLVGALLLAGATVARAQQEREVASDLRALAPEARALWPGLAAAVDEATALRAALGPGPFDAKAVFRRRYGGSVTPRQSEADRRLLDDALTALLVLERGAAAPGAPAHASLAAHDALLQRVARGLRSARDAAAARGTPAASAAVLESLRAQPRSYAEQLAALPDDFATRVGLASAAVALLTDLALAPDGGAPQQDASGPRGADAGSLDGRPIVPARPASSSRRTHPTDAGPHAPLGPARLVDTLVAAGHAEAFTLAGTSGRRGAYEGVALLVRREGALQLLRRIDGDPAAPPATLTRAGDAWQASALAPDARGVAGALAGEGAEERRLELEYRASPDGAELRGAWRTTARDGRELDAGREVLRLAGPARGLSAQLALSDLMAAIVAAVRPHAAAGAVPADLLLTTRNVASPRPLLTGPEIFGEMAALIEEAEREVLVQFFVWEPESQAAARLCEALRRLERRRAATPDAPPVRVHFTLNHHPFAFGGAAAWRAFEAQLRGLALDPRRVDLRLARHRHLLLGNLHSKAVLVDGRRALLTGANVEVCHDAGQPWFDAGFVVEGEVGRALRADYDQLWRRVTGEHLPPLDAPVDGRDAAGRTPILVAGRRPVGSPFADGVEDPQGAAFVAAMRNARERIRIQTPNLNDDAIKAALLHAVLRNGVQVELILPYRFNEAGQQVPGRGGTNLANVTELLDRVRAADPAALERLDVRWYVNPAGERIDGNGAWASHCKYATFDGHVAIVGSGNLDTTAINNSRELNVVVDDAAAVQAWDARLFEPNFSRALPVDRPRAP